MTKKIFAVSIIVFLIAVSALVFYKVFLSGKGSDVSVIFDQENVPDQEQPNDNDKTSEEDEAVLSKILDRDVKGATRNVGTAQVLFYEKQKFLTASFEGKIRNSLGAYPFVKVLDIQWHPSKEKALINDGGRYYLYSLNDNSAVELKNNADVAIWDAFGDRVVYKRFDALASKRNIELSLPGGEDQQTLAEGIPYKKVDLAIGSKGDSVCFFPTPDSTIEAVLTCIDVRTKEQRKVDQGRFGADYLWSPDGKWLLVSFVPEKTGNRLALGLINSNGSEYKGLNFSTTVKKCVWSRDSKHVYCGATTNMPQHAVLPNDWTEKKFASSDTFWKINTSNAKQTRLVDLEHIPGHLDGENYFLDSEEQNLFFIDRKTGNLYRIKL